MTTYCRLTTRRAGSDGFAGACGAAEISAPGFADWPALTAASTCELIGGAPDAACCGRACAHLQHACVGLALLQMQPFGIRRRRSAAHFSPDHVSLALPITHTEATMIIAVLGLIRSVT